MAAPHLAATLPRRTTPLTFAGRSQLLAYLLHDAVFTVGARVVLLLVAACAWPGAAAVG